MLLDTSPKATTVLVLCNDIIDIIINPRKELSWCFRGCEGEPGGKVVTSFACCNAAFHCNGVSTGSLRVL